MTDFLRPSYRTVIRRLALVAVVAVGSWVLGALMYVGFALTMHRKVSP